MKPTRSRAHTRCWVPPTSLPAAGATGSQLNLANLTDLAEPAGRGGHGATPDTGTDRASPAAARPGPRAPDPRGDGRAACGFRLAQLRPAAPPQATPRDAPRADQPTAQARAHLKFEKPFQKALNLWDMFH